jgi:N-acetylglucosamine kinase-like BadF-type ATPase
MKIIADSGSTKTDWYIENGKEAFRHVCRGLNPNWTTDDVFQEILGEIKSLVSVTIDAFYFYGSGCASEKNKLHVSGIISEFFTQTAIFVASDLLGTARALSGNDDSVIGILGTGASAAIYKHGNITQIAPNLGFIIDDSGSGASLGKMLIRDWSYEILPKEMQQAFEEKYQLSREDIIRNVYHNPDAASYLAQFAEFLSEFKEHDYVKDLINQAFQNYFSNQIEPLLQSHFMPVCLSGSVAYFFKDELTTIANSKGIELKKILRSPMDQLILYHTTE